MQSFRSMNGGSWGRVGVHGVWLDSAFLISLHSEVGRRKWFHTFIYTLQAYHIDQCCEMNKGFYCFGAGESNAILSLFVCPPNPTLTPCGITLCTPGCPEHNVQPDQPRTCGDLPAPASLVLGLLGQLSQGLGTLLFC